MAQFDYRIMSGNEVLYQANEVNITFMSYSPVSTSQIAESMYSSIDSKEMLNDYNGFFSFTLEPFSEKGSEELFEMFKILHDCEQEDKKVSIQVKPSEGTNEFITIFNYSKPELVSSVSRIEKSSNQVVFIIFMVYKN